jgi:predicted DCC family thiol-disulfide oxidoreductase YuxK
MTTPAFPAFTPLQLALVRVGIGACAFARFGSAWSGAGAILSAALLLGIYRRYAAAGLLVAGLAAAPASADVPLLLLLVLFSVAPEAEAFRWRGRGEGGGSFARRGWRIVPWVALVGGHLLWVSSTWWSATVLRPTLPAPLATAHLVLLGLLAVRPARLPAWLALGVLAFGETMILAGAWPVAAALLLIQGLTLDVRWLPVRDDARRPVLLYDGECGLCSAVVRLLLREDASGRLHFSPLQGPAAQAYLRTRGLPTADFDSLVFVPDWGRPEGLAPLRRSAGALAAADEPGGVCRVFSWLRILPGTWTDAAYRGIARVRAVFGPPEGGAPAGDPVWEQRFVR